MQDALAVIHDLAAFPPLNDADLRERTRDCSRESLVEAIETAIEDSDSEIEQSGLLEVLEKVDPKHEWLATANAAVASSEGGGGAPELALLREVPTELEHELIEAVAHLVATPADAAGIAERVLLLAPPLQARLIKRLDRARIVHIAPQGVHLLCQCLACAQTVHR